MHAFQRGSGLRKGMEEVVRVLCETSAFEIFEVRVVVRLVQLSCEWILLSAPVIFDYKSAESFTLLEMHYCSTQVEQVSIISCNFKLADLVPIKPIQIYVLNIGSEDAHFLLTSTDQLEICKRGAILRDHDFVIALLHTTKMQGD